MPKRSCPQKLLFQVCSSRAARPLFHLSGLSRPRSPAPRRFKGSCTPNCCSPSTTIVIKLPPMWFKVSLPTWNGLLISNVLLQGRRRHRSAQYECSAPNNSTYFLRFECNSLLAMLLQPYRHVLVTTEILCPGPPVRRGRWWQYTEVGSSCNLTAWNAMTLLVRRKCNIYLSVLLLMKNRHQ